MDTYWLLKPGKVKGEPQVMCPYPYYQIMRQSKDKKHWRYQMVRQALKNGIKPTAREFNTSPPVVRMWRNRFKLEGYAGLADQSHKHFNLLIVEFFVDLLSHN